MTIKVKYGGVWRDIRSIYPRGGPQGRTPGVIRVKGPSGTWVNSGYIPPATPAINLQMAEGSPTGITVTWNNGWELPNPTSYDVSLFRSNGTLLYTQTVAYQDDKLRIYPNPGSRYMVTFGTSTPVKLPGVFSGTVVAPGGTGTVTPDTNYYVTVTAKLAGSLSGVTGPLKIRTGHAEVSRQDPIGGWGSTEEYRRPTVVAATSSMPDHPPAMAVDLPNPADGASGWTTAWVSAARIAPIGSVKPHPYWEGVTFSLPDQNRLLTRVSVVANDTQDMYLGLRTAAGWRGSLTAANLGIAAAGYPTASYDDLLTHNYVAAITTNQVIRSFDVESLGLTFAYVSQLNIALTRLVPLYPTIPTTGAPAITNYRGHLQDVVCFYKPWVADAGGYKKIVVTPAAVSVSGPTVW